ncbi:hypothetical protein AMAG_01517 [Allomyces macrogynus ATCC 38327]|uniref:AAA+ ATPase domain-containing protein n=1 Tax=Allomyces macrogynus (strain ATCC 38327) TaxID=578462 RepID=A0A0L0RZS0_ALLM3|nr:hypothetical protein AMAG_01517 [Allomyces macrogynus ATCC 38327]|eukprot:KNE55630.1 hypothetical protein AMAG_01517 [Allomyces macrogynus ATCC 38327]
MSTNARVLSAARTILNRQPDLINDEYTLLGKVQQATRLRKSKTLDQAFSAAMQTLRSELIPDAGESDEAAASDSGAEQDVAYSEVGKNRLNQRMQAMYSRNKAAIRDAVLAEVNSTTPASTPIPCADGADAPGTTTAAGDVPSTPKRKARDSMTATNPKEKRRRTDKAAKSSAAVTPTITLANLGGVAAISEALLELVALPLMKPEAYQHLGISPPRGILLHGPPGCGKTSLAHAMAAHCGVPFFNISAPSVVSGMSGESEQKIRDIFQEAKEAAPCLLFIDEIDAITSKRESAQRAMEGRIVSQLLTCMDDVSFDKTGHRAVIIMGATNRPDAIDPALRRAGRFDREILMGVPDQAARAQILKVLASNLKLAGDFDFVALAKVTPGYVGADLTALVAEAGLIAVKRAFEHGFDEPSAETPTDAAMDVDMVDVAMASTTIASAPVTPTKTAAATSVAIDTEDAPDRTGPPALPPQLLETPIGRFLHRNPGPLSEVLLSRMCITNDDFLAALPKVQPSSKREGFATVPGVTWDEIGALSKVRKELRMAIVEPVARPEYFAKIGIKAPAGVLLWGPPGCGKTLLAKAVANEAHSNFLSVKGPELLNKYVGESERAVRQVFARARASAPCVIFFDEIDAIAPRRDDAKSEVAARVVNTFLTELDGMESRRNVYVIAATNRPDTVDPAMLRPGRLDKLLYVELPTPEERGEILNTVARARKTPLDESIDLPALALRPECDGFTGADLSSLITEASNVAIDKAFEVDLPVDELVVKPEHFEMALKKMRPSVNAMDRASYALIHEKLFSGGSGTA